MQGAQNGVIEAYIRTSIECRCSATQQTEVFNSLLSGDPARVQPGIDLFFGRS